MESLANSRRPLFFKDYLGQGNGKGGPVDIVKRMIQQNLHSAIKNLWITGAPGCGKTTLAQLYTRAVLCHNRPEGEYEPCGDCPVCRGEDTTNIYHYTITSPAEAREPIRRLIERSYQYPVRITDRADQFYQFFIIDEAELASAELMAMLLDPLEHSPETTIWIIISMDPEKLEKRDPVIKEAIDSRCAGFALGRLSDESIAEALCEYYPDLEYDAALALAQFSGGNMRKAWNDLATLTLLHSPADLNADFILENQAGGATASERESMWQALEAGDGVKVKSYFDQWLSKCSNPKSVAFLLEQDLLNFLESKNPDVQVILAALARWYVSAHPYPLVTVFMQHLGAKVIPFPAERTRIQVVKPADAAEVIAAEVRARASVSQQLLKIQAASTGVPKFFFCESLEEMIQAYLA